MLRLLLRLFMLVGKGLSKDAKGQKLAFRHWIEAVGPQRMYGHNLHMYHEEWCMLKLANPLSISAYYRPTDERLISFLSFLKDNRVNLDEIEIQKSNEDYNNDDYIKPSRNGNIAKVSKDSEFCPTLDTGDELPVLKTAANPQTEAKNSYRQTPFFGSLQTPKANVVKISILKRSIPRSLQNPTSWVVNQVSNGLLVLVQESAALPTILQN